MPSIFVGFQWNGIRGVGEFFIILFMLSAILQVCKKIHVCRDRVLSSKRCSG